MKKLLILLSVVTIMASCGSKQENKEESTTQESTGTYGAKIDEAGAVPVAQMMADMGGKSEISAKVEGTITECCKKKGCWMNIDKGDGTTMKVTFKDYAFFVPKDAGGKTAIMQGRAYLDTLKIGRAHV